MGALVSVWFLRVWMTLWSSVTLWTSLWILWIVGAPNPRAQ